MRSRVVLTLMLAVLLGGAVARAGGETVDQEVQKLSDDAVEAYKEGRFQRAVDLLTRAYAIRPLTPLLYNLAKAYDKLNDAENAYATYKRYVDSGEADERLMKRAQERMAFYEPQLKPKKPPEVVAPPPVVAPPKPAGPTPEEIAQQEAEARAHKRTLALTLGIVVAAVGVAAIGAGIGLYAAASGKQSDLQSTFDEDAARQLASDGQTLGIASSVMYAVGGVMVAGGALIIGLGYLKPLLTEGNGDKGTENTSKVSLAPWVGLHGAGMGAQWRF